LKQSRVLSATVIAFALGGAPLLAADLPFSRGVNLASWFEASSPRSIQFNRYAIEDFRNIKSLGADIIRLPINLHAMTSGKPDYTLDPLFLEFLDRAVDMAEETGIHIILDNHTFDPIKPTPPDIELILLKVWPQMAERYKGRSNLVLYEVLNEPHGIDVAKWGKIQGKVVEAIRKVDARHAIVVGAANYNNIDDLKRLPKYADANLVYTFHFYDPMLFTHQGADWTGPSLAQLAGVPYPPDSGLIPPVPKSLKGSWWAERLAAYGREGSPERVKKALAPAFAFARDRGVRIFCGELGVYKPNSAEADRVRWHRDLRTWLEEAGVAWAIWDAYGSFGIFKPLAGGRFRHDQDLPLVEALGFTAPPQEPWTREPESGPLSIYGDSPSPGILIDGWQKSQPVDFYAASDPAQGRYYIAWKDAARYDSFVFQFQNPKDLSVLVKEGYALCFMARARGSRFMIDVRFMNGETAPENLPWRMVRKLDSSLLPPDGKWHAVRIPLAEMTDVGAWKKAEQKWYDAEGKFSWTDVVSLQFAAEDQDFRGAEIDFDEIRIEK
jgi:endoglucanase